MVFVSRDAWVVAQSARLIAENSTGRLDGFNSEIEIRLAHPADGEDRTVASDRIEGFCMCTDQIDRYNTRFSPKGWRLRNFRANPVALWRHGHDPAVGGVPVGTWPRVWIEQGAKPGLYGLLKFASREVNPFADTLLSLYRANILKAVSVGFKALKHEVDPEDKDGRVLLFTQQELLECSPVAVPGQPGALKVAREQGIDMDPYREWLTECLDLGDLIIGERQVDKVFLEECYAAIRTDASVSVSDEVSDEVSDPVEDEQARESEEGEVGEEDGASIAELEARLETRLSTLEESVSRLVNREPEPEPEPDGLDRRSLVDALKSICDRATNAAAKESN